MLLASKPKIDRQQVADLFDFYHSNNELTYQNQMLDFYQKLDKQMLHISFSGHFSAGKSTLLNHLMGESLLPQSPIPTSANIVEIKTGKEKVVVHFTKQSPIEMPVLPPIEQLHQLCQDGEEVKKIEIFKEIAELPKGVTLMDTPGIDATNDADRLMTESSLHQVDVLFYVMDYNHVQSEVNATFLKQIDQMNKPYYIVINQMDKHDENEMTFSEFKQSLNSVFFQWGIKPHDIFFTSMTEKEEVINQFTRLQKQLYQLFDRKEDLLHDTLINGLEYSINLSIQEQQKDMDDQIQQIEEEMEGLSLPEAITYHEIEEKVLTYKNDLDNLEKNYTKLVDKTTKNAQIIPYEVREKARLLLEAYDPKFKTGLFKNRKKIREERSKRLDSFYQLLKEKTETAMEWKLREKVTEFLRPYYAVHMTEAVFETQFEREALIRLMNEGATVNGEYVLYYTDNIAQAVRKVFRQYYKQRWNELADRILSPINEKYHRQKELLHLFHRFNQLQEKIKEKKADFNAYKNQVESLWSKDYPIENSHIEKIEQELQVQVKQIEDIQELKVLPKENNSEPEQESKDKQPKMLLSYQQTLEDAKQVTDRIKGIHGLRKLQKELSRKSTSLTNHHFTIALFGAFSAGKSSFANALIGEKVLPVSPNPTTAAINKISPVKHPYQHRDVSVLVKDEKQLLTDIELIMDKEFKQLDAAYKWLNKTKINTLQVPDQHKSFLAAFTEGYAEMKGNIGRTYTIDYDTFHRYVREESIACFIKEMELFYDCEFTNQQITLVDTPGADSVNARHTDLAFSYIKDADAILFVTYYNHPFSKPDQQFLERLGKVKEAFELDKMFFIINAMDLAKDEKEKEMVTSYVRKELLQFDIQNPDIYAVSSKEALVNKSGKTGLPEFEENFHRFIQEELLQMTMHSIYTDIRRISGLVTNWLSILNSDQKEKDRLIEQYEANQSDIETIIQERDQHAYFEQIRQKLNKQIFYTIQRFEIQFTDLWKDHLHPGAIQSSGRKGRKELEQAINLFLKSIQQRLQEEYEAIVIRIEQAWNQVNQLLHDDLAKKIRKADEHFSLSEIERIRLPNPEITIRKITAEKSALSSWIASYKDSKSFFAENGRKALEEQVATRLIPEWQESMQQLEVSLQSFYQQQWEEKNTEIWNQYLQEVQDYYKQVIVGMSEQEGNKEELESISGIFEEILKGKQMF